MGKRKTKIVATTEVEAKQEKIIEVKTDNRIGNKKVLNYVNLLSDDYCLPSQRKKEGYNAWVIVSSKIITPENRTFTEDQFIDTLVKISGKSRAEIVSINQRGKNASYPDGRIHRGLYALACIAQQTMSTKDGKGNTGGCVKFCLVRNTPNGNGKISKNMGFDKGFYSIHPKAPEDEIMFPKFPEATVRDSADFLVYND